MKVEVFTAGCKICSSVEKQVQEIVNKPHEVVVYNMNDENHSSEYYKKAESYGINTVPTVVVDGKLLNCCSSNSFDKSVLLDSLN